MSNEAPDQVPADVPIKDAPGEVEHPRVIPEQSAPAISNEAFGEIGFGPDAQIYDLRRGQVERAKQAFEAQVTSSNRPEDQNVRNLMGDLPIVSGIRIGNQEFYLSEVLGDAQQRKVAVGYVRLEDGSIAPRMFYKSLSDGFWRVSPRLRVDQDAETGAISTSYSKGERMTHGYARETRLHDALEMKLEMIEQASGGQTMSKERNRWLDSHFLKERLGSADTYDNEIFEIRLNGFEDFFQFVPGEGFKATKRPARDILRSLRLDPSRMPDFSQTPANIEMRQHSLLGTVQVSKFLSRDGRLVWHMAQTHDGIVWVNGITGYNDNAVTTYGTNQEVASAGILDSKPLEYRSQISGLEEGVDYVPRPDLHEKYVELRVLDNLEPIRLFRQLRNVQRKAA